MPDVMLNWSFNHLFSGEVGLSLAVLKVRELGRGSTPPGCTVARSRQEWSRASLPHPSPSALLQGVGAGAWEASGLRSTGTPKPLALVATLLVSLHQSDPLGLNATPLPQDSSLVETPPAENKPRKRQLSEEQPSGNGVKKPKVSVCGLRSWLGRGSPVRCPVSAEHRQTGQEGAQGAAHQVHTASARGPALLT